MLGMCQPCAHLGLDLGTRDAAGAPAVTQAAQSVTEAGYVVLRQPAPTVRL
jgi:hypothetical protein